MRAAPTSEAATDTGDRSRPRAVLPALCVTQITSWGVIFYAFPVLAPHISADTGWSPTDVTAAFSAALLVSAAAGIPIGRLLDRIGPRAVMTTGSVVAVLAVLAIAAAPSLAWFAAAWLLAGTAMAAVFYPPAFAALTRWYEGHSRTRALTTLTLAGGLASTVFAPLTAALIEHLSWRVTYAVLAAILALVPLPLHAVCLRHPWPTAPEPSASITHNPGSIARSRPFLLLAASLTLSAFALYAALVGLVPLLTERGATASAAAWALGLGGVGQVLGRLGYASLVHRMSARTRSVLVLLAGGMTTALLGMLPGPVPLLLAAAVLAGTARGITTLVQATAVTDRWGPSSYATLSGILTAPVITATAIAPWVGAALAGSLGGYPCLFMVLAGLSTVAALLATGTHVTHAEPSS